MSNPIWTDAHGDAWEILDYRFEKGKRRRVALSNWEAEGRAFVPHARDGTIMLFEFGRIAYRDTADRTLAQQLAHALPVGASAAERMQRRG
jgi:hypothetical protein